MTNKHIVIISSIIDEWGGSEEIWYHTALALRKKNHAVSVLVHTVYNQHPKIKLLLNAGVQFYGYNTPYKGRIYNTAIKLFKKSLPEYKPHIGNYMRQVRSYLQTLKPDLVLLNQGVNFDGLLLVFEAYKLNIPYVTISHKAVEFFWPVHHELDAHRIILQHSRRNFYVSQHNLTQTMAQIAMDIPNTEILFNYIKHRPQPIPYPKHDQEFHLYCVGRLSILDKGQDILLQVLSQPKWKERPLFVTIVGSGFDEYMLKELCRFYAIKNVRFVPNMLQDDMWNNAHGLLLPSRSEGLPLVVLEAMAAGRMVITTVAGGSAEWVNPDCGFITYPMAQFLDETLEKAWQQREQWQQMGENAFALFSSQYPKDAIEQFASTIQTILYE
jgi:glycosyltransferase involved in cell wall biosynthesis